MREDWLSFCEPECGQCWCFRWDCDETAQKAFEQYKTLCTHALELITQNNTKKASELLADAKIIWDLQLDEFKNHAMPSSLQLKKPTEGAAMVDGVATVNLFTVDHASNTITIAPAHLDLLEQSKASKAAKSGQDAKK